MHTVRKMRQRMSKPHHPCDMMMQAALRDDCETFEKLNGMECMECGSCTYICPAKRPLTQAFKEMRKTVAANRRKKG